MEESIRDRYTSFSNLIKLRLIAQAIEHHCNEEIILLVNLNESVLSKTSLIQYVNELIEGVHSYSIDFYNVVVDESKKKVWGEVAITFNHKSNRLLYLKSAFYQKWEDSGIVKIKFYHAGTHEVNSTEV